MKKTQQDRRDENRDPSTGAAGAHPVGTGIGAAAGGVAAGTAVGSVAGPMGAAAGAAAGAVVGGLAGKAIGEMLDPTHEDSYWRENHAVRPDDGVHNYEDYAPAYRVGYIARLQHDGRSFEDAETELEANFYSSRATSRLTWKDARSASRAAWERADRILSGKGDRD